MLLERFPETGADEAMEKAVPAFCFPELDLSKPAET